MYTCKRCGKEFDGCQYTDICTECNEFLDEFVIKKEKEILEKIRKKREEKFQEFLAQSLGNTRGYALYD